MCLFRVSLLTNFKPHWRQVIGFFTTSPQSVRLCFRDMCLVRLCLEQKFKPQWGQVGQMSSDFFLRFAEVSPFVPSSEIVPWLCNLTCILRLSVLVNRSSHRPQLNRLGCSPSWICWMVGWLVDSSISFCLRWFSRQSSISIHKSCAFFATTEQIKPEWKHPVWLIWKTFRLGTQLPKLHARRQGLWFKKSPINARNSKVSLTDGQRTNRLISTLRLT